MALVYIYVVKIIKLCYEPCFIEYEPELIKTGESCFRRQILSIPVELPIVWNLLAEILNFEAILPGETFCWLRKKRKDFSHQ